MENSRSVKKAGEPGKGQRTGGEEERDGEGRQEFNSGEASTAKAGESSTVSGETGVLSSPGRLYDSGGGFGDGFDDKTGTGESSVMATLKVNHRALLICLPV